MTPNAELLPCPFCKEVMLKFFVHSLQSDRWEHPMNDCLLEGMLIMPDQVIVWNTRHTQMSEQQAKELIEPYRVTVPDGMGEGELINAYDAIRLLIAHSNPSPVLEEVVSTPTEMGNSFGVVYFCSNCQLPPQETLTADMKFCFNCGVKLKWDMFEKGKV